MSRSSPQEIRCAEARRQSLLANASPEEAEIQAFIDSVTEWPDDETSP